jgi:hypothetical protein
MPIQLKTLKSFSKFPVNGFINVQAHIKILVYSTLPPSFTLYLQYFFLLFFHTADRFEI